MWNARLDESQARIKIVRRNINILRYADDITLIAESKEELNSLLMKGKRREWKIWLECSIQKPKIMATAWQIDGETMERKQWQTLFFWAPKSLQMVTAVMKLKDAYCLEEKLWQI